MIEELNIGTDPDAAAWHIQMMEEKGYKHLGSYMNGDFQIGRFELNPALGIQSPITLSPRTKKSEPSGSRRRYGAGEEVDH